MKKKPTRKIRKLYRFSHSFLACVLRSFLASFILILIIPTGNGAARRQQPSLVVQAFRFVPFTIISPCATQQIRSPIARALHHSLGEFMCCPEKIGKKSETTASRNNIAKSHRIGRLLLAQLLRLGEKSFAIPFFPRCRCSQSFEHFIFNCTIILNTVIFAASTLLGSVHSPLIRRVLNFVVFSPSFHHVVVVVCERWNVHPEHSLFLLPEPSFVFQFFHPSFLTLLFIDEKIIRSFAIFLSFSDFLIKMCFIAIFELTCVCVTTTFQRKPTFFQGFLDFFPVWLSTQSFHLWRWQWTLEKKCCKWNDYLRALRIPHEQVFVMANDEAGEKKVLMIEEKKKE